MKKIFLIPLIIIGVIVTLGILGRITNAFQYYSAATPANEPTIKRGSKFFGSNLKSPGKFDFICFYGEIPTFGMGLRIYRICGIEDEVVEIRNGDLFVNNEMVDKKFRIQHYYTMSKPEFEKIGGDMNISEEEIMYKTADTIMICLEDNFVLKNKINATRLILDKTYEDLEVFKKFSNKWNQDNFGPIKVPKNKYFVLGDNRHNAMDSRYIGFIDKNEVAATVLWK